MFVFSNVITPQGLEPLQFSTKFRSHSLAQIISETRKSAPGVPEHTFFERFAAEHVLKANQIELDPDEIRIGMVGGGGDGGVDGIFLFVNRRFVLEDTDLKQVAGDRLSIELFVVQASRQTGFSESRVTKFGDFTQKCLRLTAKRREAVGFYKEALLNITEQFRTVYSDNLHRRPVVRLRFYYVTRADEVDPKVERRRTEFLETIGGFFVGVDCDLQFVGAPQLLKWFNKPTPVLHLGDARVGVVRMPPVRIAPLLRARPIQAGQVRARRRLDT